MLHESLKGLFSLIVWPHWKDCSQQCSKYWYLWEQFFSEPFARCVHQTYSGFKLLAATFKNPCLATDTRIFSWVRYDRSWGTVLMLKWSCCHGKMALFPVGRGFLVWWLMTYSSWDSITIGEEGGRFWQLLYQTFSIPHLNDNVCIKIWNLLCNFYNGVISISYQVSLSFHRL